MFDSLTTAALADQLGHDVEYGRIQRLGLISRQAVWFEIYANHRRSFLIASAENQAPAVYLTDAEPVSDRQLVTPLLLLLRKYVRGARIVAIQQPPLERVITLTFSSRRLPVTHVEEQAALDAPADEDERGEDEEDDQDDQDAFFTQLHCEIMGRHSNLILVDDSGLIMESAKRVTPSMSRVRPIGPRRPYTPPPPRVALDPRLVTEADVADAVRLAESSARLVRKMPSLFLGMSPQAAAEAVFRANPGSDEIPAARDLAQSIRRVFEPLLTSAWEPVVYRDEDEAIVGYSAQPMRHLAARFREETVSSISRAIELGEGRDEAARAGGRHSLRSARLASAIGNAIERLSGKIAALDAEEARHEDRERHREWGELIYGYLWQITPGDTQLIVDGQTIPLDPALEPKDQAQRYLRQYQEGKSADQHIGAARSATELDLRYLEELRTLAEQAVSIQDIEELEAEWRSRQPAGARGKAPKRSTGKKRTLPLTEVKGQPIFVGRSGAENDYVTFDVAGPDDTWLHARGVPGSHVVIRWTNSDRDDDAVLLRAAELAAWFSQSRASNRVEVDITPRRFVRKIKGAGPGMVTYRNERTVSVAPVGPD
jgi:predicted ribosome quality control (RQC) complex YloA/Tae2 family protein